MNQSGLSSQARPRLSRCDATSLLLARRPRIAGAGRGDLLRLRRRWRFRKFNHVPGQSTRGETHARRAAGVADAIDNTVSGVVAVSPVGMYVYGEGSVVQGNTVQNVVPGTGGAATGIYAAHAKMALNANRVTGQTMTWGLGINGSGADTFCKQNVVSNFQATYSGCEYTLRNLPAN